MREIDQALKKAEEGAYGYCEECGEKIDQRRLKPIPSALYYVSCQNALEAENLREEEENDSFLSAEADKEGISI